MRLLVSLCVILLSASPVLGRARVPRASPSPCTQAYVCPEPRPYPGTPDSGDIPPADQFKCRIGMSSADPNFAFCFYEKDTGRLVGATPSGVQSLCWSSGMPNPDCASSPDRKRGVPHRIPRYMLDPPAPKVSMERFKPRRAPTPVVADYGDDYDD